MADLSLWFERVTHRTQEGVPVGWRVTVVLEGPPRGDAQVGWEIGPERKMWFKNGWTRW